MGRDPTSVTSRCKAAAAALSSRLGASKVIDDPDLLAELSKGESHAAPAMPDLAVRAVQISSLSARSKIPIALTASSIM